MKGFRFLILTAGVLAALATGRAGNVPAYDAQPAFRPISADTNQPQTEAGTPQATNPSGTTNIIQVLPEPVTPPATIIVTQPPPPPRVEVVPPPPGPEYVWVPGYWMIGPTGVWIWVGGHHVIRPWPHAAWVAGRWVRHGPRYVWIHGHWH